MKRLPNGITIFNATPHVIRFWDEAWSEPVEVESDCVINAAVSESGVADEWAETLGVEFVTPTFSPTEEGRTIVTEAYRQGADTVVGSIIAAKAYRGDVVAMIPAEGYERRPPAEKRMRPDKFTTF